jgi:hypothetical protein
MTGQRLWGPFYLHNLEYYCKYPSIADKFHCDKDNVHSSFTQTVRRPEENINFYITDSTYWCDSEHICHWPIF